MPISSENWSQTARKVTDLERPDHYYLTEEDQCAFFGEYTSGKGYSFSQTNRIVSNLQKPVSTRNTPQWSYKEKAIAGMGRLVRGTLSAENLRTAVIIPAPTSKTPDHAEYDDRLIRTARAIGTDADIRLVLETITSRERAKGSTNRPGPDGLEANIRVAAQHASENLGGRFILLLDDVLVTGATFRACSNILSRQFPSVPIFGLFVARRVIDDSAASHGFGPIES